VQQFCKLLVGSSNLSEGTNFGPFVYWLGRCPFTAERWVRFPYGLPIFVMKFLGLKH
jgi:hypothetical protein